MPIAQVIRINFRIDKDADGPVETGFAFDFLGTMIASSSLATGEPRDSNADRASSSVITQAYLRARAPLCTVNRSAELQRFSPGMRMPT